MRNYKRYLFRYNGQIIKNKEFKTVFGIHFSPLLKKLKESGLDFGTHTKTYKDFVFEVMVF